MTAKVISANRLGDGIVVYLGAKGDWVERIDDSRVARGADDEAALTGAGAAAADAQIVVDPYLIDVSEDGGKVRPTKYRELLRALGPSVREDLGKQAEGAT